jgi:hypothetical protein
LCGDRSSLPNVQDCYDRANLYIDMWNGSDDHAAGTWLLRTADAWLRLAFELDRRFWTELAAEQPTDNRVGTWRRDHLYWSNRRRAAPMRGGVCTGEPLGTRIVKKI